MSKTYNLPDGMNATLQITTERQVRIRDLAKQAKADANQARTTAQQAIDAAAECGRLLVEERESLKSSSTHAGRINWELYFDAHFAGVLDIKQAAQYMQLHLGFVGPGISEGVAKNNRDRAGIVALGLLPAKAYERTPGDVPMPARLNHLGMINRFVAWRNEYTKRTRANLSPAQVARLKADFAPVAEFLAWLNRLQ